MRLFCAKHPDYKGLRRPRVKCGPCKAIFYLVSYSADLREQWWGRPAMAPTGLVFGRRPKDAGEP